MKLLANIILIIAFTFLYFVGNAQTVSESKDLESSGELEIVLDKKAKGKYDEIKISLCDQCPSKDCSLCISEAPSFGIIPQKKDKEFVFRLPEGNYSVQAYSENDENESTIMQQIKILPNTSITVVL
ncbi:MAG: hypothetical protein MI975_14615 [Cytophagales bacterium]|nr:hypothetical protein [Cytophagales bacterium]